MRERQRRIGQRRRALGRRGNVRDVYPDQAGVTDAGKVIATSQVALPGNVCETVYAQAGYEQSVTNLAGVSLDSDNVFGDDSGATQLGTVTGDVGKGYAVSLAVRVDTRTAEPDPRIRPARASDTVHEGRGPA